MTIWPPSRDAIERPAYRSLARHVAAAIEAGELAPGDRLPTHRELAWQLGLSVQTVSRAYEELARFGSISGEVGRGTFVRGADRPASPYARLDGGETVADCSMLTPVVGEVHARAMARTLLALAGNVGPAALHSFRPREALRGHVEAALGWLDRCGVRARPGQVVPTNGSTPAMTTALMAATTPGDLVATEALGHHMLPKLSRSLGLRLVGLPMDGEGVKLESFAHLCASEPVRVLCVMPSGGAVTACTMGRARRAALVAVARRHDVQIVENDAWGPVERQRVPPLAALAPERTFYVTGLSKCLLPGLRLGWLVAPEAQSGAAHDEHRAANWMATALTAAIATRWLGDGTAHRLLHWQRRALARRNRIAAEALADLPHRALPRGLHVWLALPPGWTEAGFVAAALARGVAVAPGAAFAIPGAASERGLRICIGAPTESALTAALNCLARLARMDPREAESDVAPAAEDSPRRSTAS